MKGFKNTTKMAMRHDEGACTTKAGGGIVAPMGGGMRPPSVGVAARPIMPRPRVMPTMKPGMIKALPKPKFGMRAKGGYISSPGEALEKRGGKHAYSQIEKEFPDTRELRPGYAKGGPKIKPSHRGLLHKRMGVSQGKKIPRGRIRKDLAKAKASGNTTAIKQDVFALNFGKRAEGGSIREVAKQEVRKHVATPPPRGHGIKAGNLAFMRKPLVGGEDD